MPSARDQPICLHHPFWLYSSALLLHQIKDLKAFNRFDPLPLGLLYVVQDASSDKRRSTRYRTFMIISIFFLNHHPIDISIKKCPHPLIQKRRQSFAGRTSVFPFVGRPRMNWRMSSPSGHQLDCMKELTRFNPIFRSIQKDFLLQSMRSQVSCVSSYTLQHIPFLLHFPLKAQHVIPSYLTDHFLISMAEMASI